MGLSNAIAEMPVIKRRKRASAPAGIEYNEHHRDVQGGGYRAAIFGVSDGLVTNVSLILGVAGADVDAGVVRLAGFAGMVAGAFSMAAGEFISVAAQRELVEREIEMERESIARDPALERRELTSLYQSRGISRETAERISDEVMQEPELAVEVHAREELGVNPNELGSPIVPAISSFFAFTAGAVVPLLPWFFAEGLLAVVISVVLGALAALTIGALIGLSTRRSPVYAALRQLTVGAIAGAVTYAIGSVLGVQVS